MVKPTNISQNLYILCLDVSFNESLVSIKMSDVVASTSNKRKFKDENSPKLWHERLVTSHEEEWNASLMRGSYSLDFSDFDIAHYTMQVTPQKNSVAERQNGEPLWICFES